MRLKRVRLTDGTTSTAVWHAEQWLPLTPVLAVADPALVGVGDDLIACLSGGALVQTRLSAALAAVAPRHTALAALVTNAPLLPFAPRSFRDFMLWERHVVEASRGLFRRFAPQIYAGLAAEEARTGELPPQLRPKPLWYKRPIYYMGNHLSFYPDGATIPWPSYTQALDYELELGVIIAHAVASPSPEEALAAIGGFVLVNDWSARDVQVPEMTEAQFGPVKAKHFASSMGAEVVTPDEVLPFVDELAAHVWVNGELWGTGSTTGMHHGLAAMVAYAALGEQLVPGELLATGTIPGCCGVELDRWVAPDDVVTLELAHVGRLTNRVGAQDGPSGRVADSQG